MAGVNEVLAAFLIHNNYRVADGRDKHKIWVRHEQRIAIRGADDVRVKRRCAVYVAQIFDAHGDWVAQGPPTGESNSPYALGAKPRHGGQDEAQPDQHRHHATDDLEVSFHGSVVS